MSVRVNAPIKLQVASGSWTGFVRRIGRRLDLLVETSGVLNVGESGEFQLEIPGHSAKVEGVLRVRNAGERAGPYTRYILRITDVSARNRQVLTAWMRGQLGSRMPAASQGQAGRRPDMMAPNDEEQVRRYPKGPIEVGSPIAMRTDSGARTGTLVRFHGAEFLVEVEQPIAVGGQAFFQFAVPGYGIEVYGTAAIKLEAWDEGGTHGYVFGMNLMRRADRDLLLEWLQDQAEQQGPAEDDFSGPGVSSCPTDVPSSLPPAQVRAMASSSSRGLRAPGQPSRSPAQSSARSGGDATKGRESIRDVLRRRFFGRNK